MQSSTTSTEQSTTAVNTWDVNTPPLFQNDNAPASGAERKYSGAMEFYDDTTPPPIYINHPKGNVNKDNTLRHITGGEVGSALSSSSSINSKTIMYRKVTGYTTTFLVAFVVYSFYTNLYSSFNIL